MAHTFSDNRTEVLSLDEYIAFVDENVDIYDEDAVAASAGALLALGRNRRLLTDILNKELMDWRDFQSSNLYAGQTFMLGAGKKQRFFIRANMWMPRDPCAPVSDWERRMFAYGLAHDHNFTLLTVGYLGQGYETDIFEYDSRTLKGIVEERVDLKPLLTARLAQGQGLLLRQSRDVHVQGAPSDVSISLNLMIPSRDPHARQLFFDIDTGIARDVSEVSAERSEHLVCEIAALVGDDRSRTLLGDLSRTSRNALVRETCRRLVGLASGG